MVDWNTGGPNARFRVLELLKNNFAAGDKLVSANAGAAAVYVLGFMGREGERKLLLVNKRNKDVELTLPQPGKKVEFVDQTTKNNPPAVQKLRDSKYTLGGLGVAVVTLAK
jgi:hypothetical protein